MMLPAIVPQIVPRPPERDGGEHEQQDLVADLVVEAVRQAPHDAGEAGERAADDPDRGDDPVDVDAGRCGERGVVRHGPGRLAEPGALHGE